MPTIETTRFTEEELAQFENRGISTEEVERQLINFQEGFPFMEILKAATLGDGIMQLSEEEVNKLVADFDKNIATVNVSKFIPASGAATRMFKNLFGYKDQYRDYSPSAADVIEDANVTPTHSFFEHIEQFAFYDSLKAALKEDGIDLDIAAKRHHVSVLDKLLGKGGMNYGTLPKGLLKFHTYSDHVATPVEEHLKEGAAYAQQQSGLVQLHFTVSPQHLKAFKSHVAEVQSKYEAKFGVKYEISYSIQKPSTDTIAVTNDNKPFVEEGTVLFRPGGHGALIENLNDIDAEVIFIKNIDNVVNDRVAGDTITYKKVLASVAMKTQEQIFAYLKQLDEPALLTANDIEEIANFVQQTLCVVPSQKNPSRESKIDWLKSKLNRPIRACGMVKNEGEPGGGPFWAVNNDQTISLQIVESSQINLQSLEKLEIVNHATHFNPVDLVCLVKDYQGNKFDLKKYVDPKTGFITLKSRNGQEIKAQELPGLWNGAMSDWNTIFIEVPIMTFNPVKTVNDLLRDNHQ
ncbi:DUF4301 family protein [Persicobacter psychrovividus]|uniref:DUF4301 domain-containing protein n=1 Tax=Persicobacter psychrovividus TaxID=387638 RepID=A0ABM7VC05_9BACT|nr:hypothetical protein PEPS_07370 [Persicobacter psychrovividus]